MSKATNKLKAKAEVLEIKQTSYISGQNISFHSAEKGDDFLGKIIFPEILLMKKFADFIFNHGGCAMPEGTPNCLSKSGVTPPLKMVFRTVMGLRSFNLAVRMIVIIKETFFFPCSVRFPKEIFLNKTLLRIPVSAMLFVGEIRGYFRKTKSSCLCVISRLRMLSALWCDSGMRRYNFLNLLRISFLPERHSSEVKWGCRL